MKNLSHEEQYIKKIQSKADETNRVYVFNELALEITRRCPLNCEHCMKGDSQEREMSRQVMEDFFEHVMGIRCLSLASGETTLAVYKIKMLNECLRKYKPTVEKVFIYTNGTNITDEYINELKLLQQYVVQSASHHGENKFDMRHGLLKSAWNSGNSPLVVAVSNDKYHKKARELYFEKQSNQNVRESQEKFVAGIEKLIENFPVGFVDDGVIFNLGKAKQLSGVIKYKLPAEKIGVWCVPKFGVEVVHTYPHMGVCYDGSLGEVRLSYDDQDLLSVKPDKDKTMYQRLLEVPNVVEVQGNDKNFRRWIASQELKSEMHKLNPLNYTKKAEEQEKI